MSAPDPDDNTPTHDLAAAAATLSTESERADVPHDDDEAPADDALDDVPDDEGTPDDDESGDSAFQLTEMATGIEDEAEAEADFTEEPPEPVEEPAPSRPGALIDWSSLGDRPSEPELDPTEAAQRVFAANMETEEAGVAACLEALRSLPHVSELPAIEIAIQGLRIAAEALREKQARHPHSTPAEAVRAIDGLADILRADRHLVALYRHLLVLADNQWINPQALHQLLEHAAAFDPTLPQR